MKKQPVGYINMLSGEIKSPEEQYEDAVDQVKAKYEPRILRWFGELAEELSEINFDVDGPEDWTDDEYAWSMSVYSPDAKDKDDSIDVTFKIVESKANDGSLDGVNFMVDIVRYGGEIVGSCAPHNYTNQVWVALNKPDAIEYRFAELLEGCPPYEVAYIIEHADRS